MYSFNYGKVLRTAHNEGWFQPKPNELLEIRVGEQTQEPVVTRQPSDEDNIQSLIAQKPWESTLGGLRLMICAPLKAANDAGRSFPFRKPTFDAIVQMFCLPKSYLQSVFDGSPSFAKFGPSSGLGNTDITGYVLKTMWASGMNFALAISHDVQTGVTSGILYGCLEDEVEVVIDRISAAGTHACHPLMVPTVLYELVTERNVQRTKASEGAMNDIELATGEHIYASRKQPDLQSIDSGGSMTARVNGTATTSMFTSANINSTILGFNALLENIDSSPPIAATPRQLRAYEDGIALKECIRYCLSISSNLQLEAEQIRSRANTQISAVRYQPPSSALGLILTLEWQIYSLIAQRDSILNLQVANGSNALADAARRDSSAMKTIAVLTILFLPGTFVAVRCLFSTPIAIIKVLTRLPRHSSPCPCSTWRHRTRTQSSIRGFTSTGP